MSIYGRYAYYHMGYCCFVRHWKTIKYYADWNDVDEDMRTVPAYGGRWYEGNQAGIALRNLYNNPSFGDPNVAYKR